MMRSADVLQAAPGRPLELAAIERALSVRFAVTVGGHRKVRRTRLDTFDGRLRAAGLVLEHHVVTGVSRLVLVRADARTLEAVAPEVRWPALVEVLPAGPIREAVVPIAGIRALTVIAAQRRLVRRLELHNREGKTVVRLELDEPGSDLDAGPRLTVAPLRGYDGQARRAVELLLSAGLERVPPDELTSGEAVAAAPARVDGDSAVSLLADMLGDYAAAMGASLPGLIADVDTEFLHDFRVALRRTRSTLKLGRAALPAEMRSTWEPAFKRIGDTTSALRDLDVYVLGLPTMASWLVAAKSTDLDAFGAHLWRRRTAERVALMRSLRSARFRRLLREWDVAIAGVSESVAEEAHALSAGELAQQGIARAHRRVMRDGAAISSQSPPADLHDLRGRCKELRYALDVFAPVIDAADRGRSVAELKGLQDVLGRFQDSEVQRAALRDFADEMVADGTPAVTLLAMGELIGHLDAEQDRARREFESAFARFARRSSQQLMGRLGGGL